ncbi:MAG: nucleoside 2-deoxyribosyltransferase [Anaerolineaceae bacterium]|nr:nucleoside 2-deoxyribosyltransferase [Anaerolineaceae bacterium]
MNANKAVDSNPEAANTVGPFTVYAAGGLFTQDELTTNVLIKEAVWRLSNGKFQLFLPQSMELQGPDKPDAEANIRNIDLLAVVSSDIVLARFDGLELDAGTVIEFAVAKSLGKPTVILRCDFRRLHSTGQDDPYNLMAKNWPRTVSIHFDSLVIWAGLLASERQAPGSSQSFEATMKAELGLIQKSIDKIALQVITAMEEAMQMKSPFPPEYQEMVYKAARFSPGSGFDELLTERELGEIIQRLRKNGTL